MIRLKFFAYLRESLGRSDMELEGQDGMTIAEIKQNLISRGAPWDILEQEDVLCALNQTISGEDAQVNAGDELAFFPPVTGG
jgi:molybdopterin synthase sulfur carrier subunit